MGLVIKKKKKKKNEAQCSSHVMLGHFRPSKFGPGHLSSACQNSFSSTLTADDCIVCSQLYVHLRTFLKDTDILK